MTITFLYDQTRSCYSLFSIILLLLPKYDYHFPQLIFTSVLEQLPSLLIQLKEIIYSKVSRRLLAVDVLKLERSTTVRTLETYSGLEIYNVVVSWLLSTILTSITLVSIWDSLILSPGPLKSSHLLLLLQVQFVTSSRCFLISVVISFFVVMGFIVVLSFIVLFKLL